MRGIDCSYVHCPSCGKLIEDGLEICDKCKETYHKECLDYDEGQFFCGMCYTVNLRDSDTDDTLDNDVKLFSFLFSSKRGRIFQKLSYIQNKDFNESISNKIITPFDGFSLFFTEKMMEQIIEFTNKNLSNDPHWEKLSTEEFKIFIGILLALGSFGYMNTDDTFKKIFVKDYMTKNRFKSILNGIRLSDEIMEDDDKMALISNIWSQFVHNLRSNFSCGQNITLFEHILVCQKRCPLKLRTPSEINKYGMKIFFACDSKTNYIHNAVIYLPNSDLIVKNNDCFAKYDISTNELIQQLLNNIECDGIKNLNTNLNKISNEINVDMEDKENVDVNANCNKISNEIKNMERVDVKTNYIEIKNLDDEDPNYNRISHAIEEFSTRRPTKHWTNHILFLMLDIAWYNGSILTGCKHSNKLMNYSYEVAKYMLNKIDVSDSDYSHDEYYIGCCDACHAENVPVKEEIQCFNYAENVPVKEEIQCFNYIIGQLCVLQ